MSISAWVRAPALPPEKEFKGRVDEAYGHFQRGEYVQALDKALNRAQNGDASAQTLVAEMMSRGLGIARDEKPRLSGISRLHRVAIPLPCSNSP